MSKKNNILGVAADPKRTQDQIKKQTEFLNLILESLTHPFYVIDATHYTISLANSAAHLGPLTKDSTCYFLVHKQNKPCGSAEHPCPLEIIKNTKQSVTVEHVHYDQDRDPIHIEVHAYPIFDLDGNVSQIIEYFLDITKRKRAEEALRRSNEELLREHNQRKSLSKRLIDLQEKERHQIAMELHDHIGQTLTSLKIHLEMIHSQLGPGNSELGYQIKAAEEKTIHLLRDIRNISHGLKPSMLDTLGLVASLRGLFSDIEMDTNMEIKFFSRNIPKRFNQEKELALYRITQEALANIIKHARAKKVFVNLVKKGTLLSLSVEDDGVGFDQEKIMNTVKREGTLGLLIMRERAIQLDGECTIESQIGKGTHVLVEIPI